jgi:hypothetical protein
LAKLSSHSFDHIGVVAHRVLEAYSPYEAYFTAAYHISADGTQIIGDHPIDGHFASTARFVVAADRPTLGSVTFTNVTQLQKVMDAGRLINTGGQTKSGAADLQVLIDDHDLSGAAGLELVTGENSTPHFVATVGWNSSGLSDIAS